MQVELINQKGFQQWGLSSIGFTAPVSKEKVQLNWIYIALVVVARIELDCTLGRSSDVRKPEGKIE